MKLEQHRNTHTHVYIYIYIHNVLGIFKISICNDLRAAIPTKQVEKEFLNNILVLLILAIFSMKSVPLRISNLVLASDFPIRPSKRGFNQMEAHGPTIHRATVDV